MLIAAGVMAAVAAFIVLTAAFWINWWWYGSVGYRSVLVTRYTGQAVAFVVFGVIGTLIFFGNAVFALRRTSRPPQRRSGRVASVGDRLVLGLLIGVSVVVLLLAGSAGRRNWQDIWLFLEGEGFGRTDPVFGRDVGFFIFALPVLHLVRSTLTWVILASLVAVALIYTARLGVDPRNWRQIPGQMRTHLLALLGVLLLLIGAGFWLASYELAYSTRGFVFGAGYTDANVQRRANYLMAFFSIAVAVLLVLNAFVDRLRLLVAAVAAWAVVAIVATVLLPPAIQRAFVEPSEYNRERPYIANNIEATRAAFGLEDVAELPLDGQSVPTADALAANPVTLDNIRLWDYRIVQETYQQNQSFAPYYVFNDVDVDRYLLEDGPTQVLLSARELDVEGLPENAQTWTNRRLTYTHGYGAVVSPVGDVANSLPVYLVGNIPPNGTGPLTITQPQIYFGEGNLQWVILNTDQAEFDGLIGDAGVEPSPYAGRARGSIDVGGTMGQLFAAVYFGDRNILLSGTLTGESRLLFRRDIVERTREIAPFLSLEPDPYLVIADGRLFWVIDAYTTTDRFPHATRQGEVNYIRNSVKVVVDAYDGTVTFYRTEVPDPIADAYAGIYGDLFTPIAEAPPAIVDHFRYPERLFDLQTEAFASYHVTDPRLFYDGEERWTVAQEQVGGQVQQMVPYYVTLTLPGEQAPGFTLIRPFTPGGRSTRQNMTAWIAARLDGPTGAPRLVAYQFPRQETVLGPRQIEARIDQDPEISAQISLWSQAGSEVIRGNLLVIPIGEGMLYVQPLYLRANSEAAFPELRRIIVATSAGVEMQPTLDQALAAVVAPGGADAVAVDPPEPSDEPVAGGQPSTDTPSDLPGRALAAYERGQEALARGDWQAYGEAQTELEQILRQLAEGTDAVVAEATPLPQ